MKSRTRSIQAGARRALLLLLPAAQILAQYPGSPVKKLEDSTQPKLRSTAILEWVGEPGKPSASRIVPIAVFDGERYQDGGLYLSQPEPLAVMDGTEYELEQSGVPQGKFVIFHGGQVDHDWFGYGVWRALPPPKVSKSKPSKTPPRVVTEANADKPAFANKENTSASGSGKPASGQGEAAKTSSTASGKPRAVDSSQQDPDRPTLHRRSAGDTPSTSGEGTSADPSADSGSKAAPQDVDPDRPTLHRRSDSAAAVAPAGERDPDRPTLRRGAPAAGDPSLQASRLTGMPPDLQQMVAISDSAATEDHPFQYQWASPGDALKMKAALEEIAKKAIAAAAVPRGFSATASLNPAAKTRPAASKTNLNSHATPKTPAASLLPQLRDEKFNAYELSYSGGATLVLTASSGTGAAERDVTIIAQPDFYGVPHVLLQSVADPTHLDMTPRMRLIDAVDTAGNNRADLIFELRGETDRQFAIYKIASGRAEQVFTTGLLPGATTRD